MYLIIFLGSTKRPFHNLTNISATKFRAIAPFISNSVAPIIKVAAPAYQTDLVVFRNSITSDSSETALLGNFSFVTLATLSSNKSENVLGVRNPTVLPTEMENDELGIAD